METVKVAVTGAAGQIAYQLIPSLLKGEVFGHTKIELNLIDIEAAQDTLVGVMMEIEDMAFPLLSKVNAFMSHDLENGFKDIDFAFLVGASPRGKGMERSDLLEKNGHIFKEQGKALSAYAKHSVNVLVVGNPCNTNCLIAMHHASQIPNTQFYAMMMLDENRAKFQIAKRQGIAIDEVNDVFIYGNHSSTQFPDFENAVPALDLSDAYWLNEFVPMIQTRGAAVIQARGASSAASAAHAAIQTAYAIVTQSSEPFSVARISKGEHGAPKGLIVSIPSFYEGGECKAYGEFKHSDKAAALIKASYQELADEYEQVKSMGLLDVD